MPNWCDNKMQITGPNKIIDKIERIVKEEDNQPGLLQYFCPMPKELADSDKFPADGSDRPDLVKKYGHSSWYDWAVNNWGTKWEVCEFYGVDRQELTEQNEGESTITFAFNSAWAPPINALAHWLEQNEECQATLSYYEGGCDFMGIWDNFDDNEYSPSDYKSDDPFWESGVGKQLDEDFNLVESISHWEEEQKEEESA
jgi:hypothetical protein